MDTLTKYEKVQNLLDTALYFLETIDDNNFDYHIKMLQNIAKDINSFKKNFDNIEIPKNYEHFRADIKNRTKLISQKLDNIIEEKKSESEAIAVDLKHLENQRKLAIYNR